MSCGTTETLTVLRHTRPCSSSSIVPTIVARTATRPEVGTPG